jgi:hypothetical protein
MTLFNGTNGTFPLPCVIEAVLTLYEASARESEECRFGVGQQLSQVRA